MIKKEERAEGKGQEKRKQKAMDLEIVPENEELDYFTTLNDDCIFEILERLSLDDLGALSRTCKKLHQMSEHHFQRRYPHLKSKRIYIVSNRFNDVLCFHEKDRYVKYFSRHIENVVINLPHRKLTDHLLQFMDVYCSKDIKKMKFISGSWAKSFKRGINEWLGRVETLFIDNHTYNDVCLDDALKLPLVKKLKFYDLYNKKLPLFDCPNLEVFDCCIATRSPGIMNDLKVFFERCPKLKRFTCRLDPRTDRLKQLLEIVIPTRIEELFIEFFGFCGKIDFKTAKNELRMLDQREHFKRLEIKIDAMEMKNSSELTSLKSFTGFYFANWKQSVHVNRYIEDCNSFRNLTILLMRGYVSETFSTNLAKNLPNLKIMSKSGKQSNDVQRTIMPFARFARKLNSMIVHEEEIEPEVLDINSLNAERSKLDDAEKLVIYLVSWIGIGPPKVLQKDETSELIDIKRVTYTHSQHADLHNPFIPFEFSCEDVLTHL